MVAELCADARAGSAEIGFDALQEVEPSGHFFAAAAEGMRRILVDNVRGKQSLRRGGDRERCDLIDVDVQESPLSLDLLALSESVD